MKVIIKIYFGILIGFLVACGDGGSTLAPEGNVGFEKNTEKKKKELKKRKNLKELISSYSYTLGELGNNEEINFLKIKDPNEKRSEFEKLRVFIVDSPITSPDRVLALTIVVLGKSPLEQTNVVRSYFEEFQWKEDSRLGPVLESVGGSRSFFYVSSKGVKTSSSARVQISSIRSKNMNSVLKNKLEELSLKELLTGVYILENQLVGKIHLRRSITVETYLENGNLLKFEFVLDENRPATILVIEKLYSSGNELKSYKDLPYKIEQNKVTIADFGIFSLKNSIVSFEPNARFGSLKQTSIHYEGFDQNKTNVNVVEETDLEVYLLDEKDQNTW